MPEREIKDASCLNEVQRLPVRYGDVVERGRDSVDVNNKEEMRARSRVVRRVGPPVTAAALPPQAASLSSLCPSMSGNMAHLQADRRVASNAINQKRQRGLQDAVI